MGPEQADPAPLARADFWRVLASRRMCRDFTNEELPQSVLESVVRSGFRGPSAGNTAGLDLVMLTGEATERYWSVTLSPQRRGEFRWPGLLNAPVLVIPYVDPGAYVQRYGRVDKAGTGLGESVESWPVPYWFIDGGAAVMAMLLAAEAEGLGALFFGQFNHESALREAFGVPERHRAIGTLAIGYAAADGRTPSRSAEGGRPDWSAFTHNDRW